jgi:hypothetical protein
VAHDLDADEAGVGRCLGREDEGPGVVVDPGAPEHRHGGPVARPGRRQVHRVVAGAIEHEHADGLVARRLLTSPVAVVVTSDTRREVPGKRSCSDVMSYLPGRRRDITGHGAEREGFRSMVASVENPLVEPLQGI